MPDVKTYVIILIEGDDMMDAISITKARANLYQTVAEVNEYSKPITITNLMTAYGITSNKKVTNSFKGRGKLVY